MSDDPKKIILARRARFVAAAMASMACGKESGVGSCNPARPCLEPPIYVEDASAPKPCLSVMWQPEDAGPPPDTEPRPCLSMRRPDDQPSPPPDAGKKK